MILKACPICHACARAEPVTPPIPDRRFDWAVYCSERCQEDQSYIATGLTLTDAISDWNIAVDSGFMSDLAPDTPTPRCGDGESSEASKDPVRTRAGVRPDD